MPEIMAHIVPLASRARFGVDIPPLNEEHTLPKGTKLHCDFASGSLSRQLKVAVKPVSWVAVYGMSHGNNPNT